MKKFYIFLALWASPALHADSLGQLLGNAIDNSISNTWSFISGTKNLGTSLLYGGCDLAWWTLKTSWQITPGWRTLYDIGSGLQPAGQFAYDWILYPVLLSLTGYTTLSGDLQWTPVAQNLGNQSIQSYLGPKKNNIDSTALLTAAHSKNMTMFNDFCTTHKGIQDCNSLWKNITTISQEKEYLFQEKIFTPGWPQYIFTSSYDLFKTYPKTIIGGSWIFTTAAMGLYLYQAPWFTKPLKKIYTNMKNRMNEVGMLSFLSAGLGTAAYMTYNAVNCAPGEFFSNLPTTMMLSGLTVWGASILWNKIKSFADSMSYSKNKDDYTLESDIDGALAYIKIYVDGRGHTIIKPNKKEMVGLNKESSKKSEDIEFMNMVKDMLRYTKELPEDMLGAHYFRKIAYYLEKMANGPFKERFSKLFEKNGYKLNTKSFNRGEYQPYRNGAIIADHYALTLDANNRIIAKNNAIDAQ